MSEAAYTAALKRIREERDKAASELMNGTFTTPSMNLDMIGAVYIRLFATVKAFHEADRILVEEMAKLRNEGKDDGEAKPEIY